MAEIGLADVVRALRTELETAMGEAKGERLQFEPKAMSIEFHVGVTKSTEGKGGIRFWVLELGGGGSFTSESIQKVSLSLEPILASGGRVRIAQGTTENPLAENTSRVEGPLPKVAPPQ